MVAAPSRGVKKGQSQPCLALTCIFLWVKPFETMLDSAYMPLRAELDEINSPGANHSLIILA
jgi:hypothetical protein